jgi:uroporphyrinogen III methyltransferase/synthase
VSQLGSKATAKIYLIGVGPGDPGLLTVRGREIIEKADVLLYSKEVNSAFLRYAKADATLLLDDHNFSLATMLEQAKQSQQQVAWLQPDLFDFELAGLLASKLPFEIVPGVPSLTAIPVYAGMPISYPASKFFSPKIEQKENFPEVLGSANQWALAVDGQNILCQLPITQLETYVAQLLHHGNPPETLISVVKDGTTWQQQVISGTLADIEVKVEQANLKGLALVLVGELVRQREQWRWFDLAQNKPLLGKRVVVTRARVQASTLLTKLTELGADALEFAAFKIVAPADLAPLDAAIAELETYDWVIFTSVNGPEFFMQRLDLAGKDARAFAKAKICAIGPATAAALARYNLKADLIPAKFVAESILESFQAARTIAGQRFLLARADVARENLAVGLTAMGAIVHEVVAYRQIIADEADEVGSTGTSPAEMAQLLEAGQIDAVLFTSSNTVRNFAKRLATVTTKPLKEYLHNTVVACIGPITTAAARDEYDLEVTLEAAEFTIDRLVETLVYYFGSRANKLDNENEVSAEKKRNYKE